MSGSRGRVVAILAALGVVLLGSYCLVSWDDFVIRRYVGRLRTDPEYLRQLIDASDDTPEGMAVRAYLGEVQGQRALLELYLGEGPFRIFREASPDEALEWGVRGILGFDGKSAWFRIVSPKFPFDLMRETDLVRAVSADPRFDPSFFRSVTGLLSTLEDQEITLERHPRLKFTILRGNAAYENSLLTHPDGRRPDPTELACLVERAVLAPVVNLVKNLESSNVRVRLHTALDLFTMVDEPPCRFEIRSAIPR